MSAIAHSIALVRLAEFNVGLEQSIGLLLTVWDSSVTILNRHGGDGSSALVPPEV